MSAESPIKTQLKVSPGNNTILPQQVTDPTILESVAGFINDVVPTTYTFPSDSKDQIQWARFENIEHGDLINYKGNYDCDKILPPPVLLVLGYTTGTQIWAIPANGEAVEILSWRHGSVRVLRILPAPNNVGQNEVDLYASKRPLIALCDNVAPGTDFCSLSFISLKTGEQVKLIKFKNPILDVVANKRSVVVTFSERIAVFDAFNLEDRLTITTCYLSPGIFANPISLGTRWLAYAENKLIPSRRSSGGNDGEGVQSYTATVLHAAKSLGRGLRELGETVASSLTGNVPHKPGSVLASGQSCGQNDVLQKGVVTILDIESPTINNAEKHIQTEAIVAHFTAHKEAIVYLSFDPSGLLLLTADKRGYDFHLFRIHPHPGGPALAAVHHLYILHRGDTTARVQDMSFSPDSRWATISTLRGTTHVFPITPYGGNVGVRTHATPHVVNKMSRFHRSAGLTAEGRSNSPVSIFEAPVNSNLPYHNPRLPPYPHPTVVQPLAQIRQPLFIQNSSTQQRPNIGRQRLGSSSEDNIQVALRVCVCFAPARAWIEPISQTREPVISKLQVKPVESLFIMSLHGSLIQYDLEPHHTTSVPKEKVCDDTLIELSVCAKAQWILQRQSGGKDIQLPLSSDNLSLFYKEEAPYKNTKPDHTDDRWLSQVEIVTHAGPHRRLWMGPQFTFKTYNNGIGAPLNILEAQSIDVVRSKPVNMPISAAYPILIEAGSVSSCEPSPKLLDTLQRNFDEVGGAGEIQLREDLADAMLESPGVRDAGGRCVIVSMKQHNSGVAKVVNPLGMVVTVQSDEESDAEPPEEVIHENCDEALFRPVVASKAVVFAEPKNFQAKIATNVLHVNANISGNKLLARKAVNEKINKTESILSICKKSINQMECDDLKKNKTDLEKDYDNIANKRKIKIPNEDNQKGVKCKNKVSDDMEKDQILDVENKEPNIKINKKSNKVKQEKKVVKQVVLPALIDTGDNLDLSKELIPSKEANVEELQDPFLDASIYEDVETISEKFAKEEYEFSALEDISIAPKVTVFESGIIDKQPKKKVEKDFKEIVSSSEENNEEKPISKKIRKPKPKLGVRIGNLNKSIDEKKDDSEDLLPSFTSWSSIVSEAKSDSILDLPEIESVESFTKDIPKLSYSAALKDFSHEPVKILEPEKSWVSDDLIKIDKSSDDEKVENNSSQTETTESDDSSKIPPIIIMDTEEDPQLEINKPKQMSTKSKKSKKKRR